MTTDDKIAIARAIRSMSRAVSALREAATRKQPIRESLTSLSRQDGERITPTDLYNAVREMAAGFGGEIGKSLNAATTPLYQASAAYEEQQEQYAQQRQQRQQQYQQQRQQQPKAAS